MVPQGARACALTARLGATLKTKKRGRIAISIALTAYLPPDCACPELLPDGRCAIHTDKPLRCRTMPFYPYRETSDQLDLLKPRKGWLCETGDAAPVVYRDKQIVEAADFEAERAALLEQAPLMQRYADYMLKYSSWIADDLAAMAGDPEGALVTSLSSFLTANRQLDAAVWAAAQLPVLQQFEARMAERADWVAYGRQYAGWIKEMAYLAQRD